MKTKKRHSASRRQFLKDAGQSAVMATLWDTVVGSLLLSQSTPAFAQGVTNFKNFLHVDLFTSPPRWMWDLFLNPTNNANLFLGGNKTVCTTYTGAGPYIDADFTQVRYGTSNTFVPYLWGQMVPRASGGTVEAWELLRHMMNIRGIDAVNAGHTGASELHQQAVVGSPTITSMTADRAEPSPTDPAQNMIRAMVLNSGPASVFLSKSGLSQFRYDVSGGGVNDLTRLFTTMQPVSTANGFTPIFVNNQSALEGSVNTALNAMNPAARHYYKNLLDNSGRSLRILTDNTLTTFSQLSNEWTQLYGKYRDLIQRTLSGVYPRINDRPIGRVPATDDERNWYQFNQGQFLNPATQTDLRSIMTTANYDRLAAQFAVTEFLMTRKLTPSTHLLAAGFGNLTFNGARSAMVFDQHFQGFMPYLMVNSLYYLSLTACMIELIDRLKAAGLFNDTLIYMSSEFNRAPRVNGSGSDHGHTGAHISLLSGRISQFRLVGNIYKDSAGVGSGFPVTYKGTWGHGSPINGARLNIIQVWGSIMALLGLPISNLPNAVRRNQLLFNTPGSFALPTSFNGAAWNGVPQTEINASKA